MPLVSLPPWERTLDAGFHRYIDHELHNNIKNKPTQAVIFKNTTAMFYLMNKHRKEVNENKGLFLLPEKIRIRIYEFVLGEGEIGKPIRLNPMSHLETVWYPAYFDTLGNALGPISGALATCFGLRAELMSVVFMGRRFHVVFSPFVREKLHPLATNWMNTYGHLMQLITIEFDLTKLGYGREPAAVNLRPGNLNVMDLAEDFVTGQKERPKGTTMTNLVVLCRRFYGTRPVPNPHHERDPMAIVTYVGPEHEALVDPVCCLRGMVDSARIVGFSNQATTKLIKYLYHDMPASENLRKAHSFCESPSCLYPLLPGQSSYLDYGPKQGGIRLVHHAGMTFGPSSAPGPSSAGSVVGPSCVPAVAPAASAASEAGDDTSLAAGVSEMSVAKDNEDKKGASDRSPAGGKKHRNKLQKKQKGGKK